MKRPTLVERYLSEIIDYGGEAYTRGEAILHMQSLGMEQRHIECWFQGYEHGERLREQREVSLGEETDSPKNSPPRMLA